MAADAWAWPAAVESYPGLMRRTVVLSLCLPGLILNGCLGRAVGALVAPQTLAAEVAYSVANQGTAAVEAATTTADIDRILAANPEAANSAELLALRGELAQRTLPATAPSSAVGASLPKDFERRGQVTGEAKGTTLLVEQRVVEDLRTFPGRAEAAPFTTARTSSIPPARPRIYQYGWNPDPKPLATRRGAE